MVSLVPFSGFPDCLILQIKKIKRDGCSLELDHYSVLCFVVYLFYSSIAVLAIQAIGHRRMDANLVQEENISSLGLCA